MNISSIKLLLKVLFYSIILFSTTGCFFSPFSRVSLFPEPDSPELIEHTVKEGSKDKILVLHLDGVISDEASSDFWSGSGESMLSLFKKQLAKAEKDNSIKGILFKINSPGGSVTASDIIYRELKEFKTKKKIPVLALFMDLSASGGYYVAMASDYIMAHPTTLTGSIGVILGGFNVKEGLDKIGVKFTPITSGKNKTILAPYLEMTQEQKDILQSIVDETYEGFYSKVKENRKAPDSLLRPICDGRVFTAKQALSYKLIDKIGYFEDAVDELSKRKDFSKSDSSAPTIILYSHKRKNIKSIYEAQIPEGELVKMLRNLNSMATGPRLLYYWPGF